MRPAHQKAYRLEAVYPLIYGFGRNVCGLKVVGDVKCFVSSGRKRRTKLRRACANQKIVIFHQFLHLPSDLSSHDVKVHGSLSLCPHGLALARCVSEVTA